jgi:hypothetical protein
MAEDSGGARVRGGMPAIFVSYASQDAAYVMFDASSHKGTEQDGSDVYDAEFAKGRAQFRLLFQEDGKIAGASFETVP